MKKILLVMLALSMCLALFAGCVDNTSSSSSSKTGTPTTTKPVSEEKGKIQVAALETAYGSDMWKEVIAAFTEETGIEVELIIDKTIEDVIRPNFVAGNAPDFVFLSLDRKQALTETMIKDKLLLDVSDVLEMTVPGESVKVSDKLVPGFTDTLSTNPYGDGKTYLAPMFYGPTGLFYSKSIFAAKGWEVPKTWDEMWALGDKVKAEGTSLFAYPTTGYFDAFTYGLLAEAGGADFFNKATTYEAGVWDTEPATQVFDTIAKLATYTHPTVPSNANDQNFQLNQQLVIDGTALFMPNGTWIVDEMKDTTPAGFEWGMMALPALKDGGDRYATTFFEQCWIPSVAKNTEDAKTFMAFMYSDKATEAFAKSGAVQPVKDVSSKLTGDNVLFYSIYDTGAKAVMGGFSKAESVEGISIGDSFFAAIDSLVSGTKTKEEWISGIKSTSDKLRESRTE